jgi:hypothetical protein
MEKRKRQQKEKKKVVKKAKVETPRKGYWVIDIEKSGDVTPLGIVAVASLLGDTEGNIIKEQVVCFKVPKESDFEERCWKEFWNKPGMRAILDRIIKESKSTASCLKDIEEFKAAAEKEFPGRNLTIVSDNPAFDIADLDYLRYTLSDAKKLRYTAEGTYRSISDPSEQLEALGLYKKAKAEIEAKFPHDHWPGNDVRHIYHMQLYADRCSKKLQEYMDVAETFTGKTDFCELLHLGIKAIKDE